MGKDVNGPYLQTTCLNTIVKEVHRRIIATETWDLCTEQDGEPRTRPTHRH